MITCIICKQSFNRNVDFLILICNICERHILSDFAYPALTRKHICESCLHEFKHNHNQEHTSIDLS